MSKVMYSRFRNCIPLEQRRADAEKVVRKHPDHIPVIIERDPKSKDLSLLEDANSKFMVPRDITVQQMICVVRKRAKIRETDSIFLFIGGKLPRPDETMGSIYQAYRNEEDGLLYCIYSSDQAFG